jgi:hypothetical protein
MEPSEVIVSYKKDDDRSYTIIGSDAENEREPLQGFEGHSSKSNEVDATKQIDEHSGEISLMSCGCTFQEIAPFTLALQPSPTLLSITSLYSITLH